MQTTDNADIFYRITGGVMLLSGLWNAFMSFVWFLSFIWLCVGVFWIIPGLLSLCYVAAGVYLLATGKQTKVAAFAPGLGILISVMNLNLFGGMLDLVALVLGIVGFTQHRDEITMQG